MPLDARLAGLFLLGLVLGALVNLAVYRLAYQPRSISPWSAPPPRAPRRRWFDFLPVVGWLGLRRETPWHGRGFWIRPLCVELSMGGLAAGLYWWEVVSSGLIPGAAPAVPPALAALATPQIGWALHIGFACHLALVGLMLATSLIDVDEKTIPDALTLPGTLLGLTAAALYPWSLLPNLVWILPQGLALDFVRLNGPDPIWPAALAGAPQSASLAIALACWWGWCVAIMPRRWILRRGWRQAWIWFWGGLGRESLTWLMLAIGVSGSLAIGVAWMLADAAHWSGLLTALVGVAGAGGLIWLVRIVGSAALGREAMGFGDVTLMAMLGALLGWQAAVITFFLAPFAGLLVGVIQFLLRRDQVIPYGPFLCLGAVSVVVGWRAVWPAVAPVFALGWLVPAALLACVLLLGLMLRIWRTVRERVLGWH